MGTARGENKMGNKTDDKAGNKMLYRRDDLTQLREARHDAAQLIIFDNWVKEHPEFDYTAAKNCIQEYYHGEDWTLENLTESAERLVEKGIIKPLRLQAKTTADVLEEENDERKELVDFILTHRKYTPEGRRAEKARFLNAKVTHIGTLRQIKENILEARRLSALDRSELKQEVRDNAAAVHGTPGYMPVPELYKTRSMLISLANENVSEFRSLVRRCGQAAIDAILQTPERE
jgi:hypothetical protein